MITKTYSIEKTKIELSSCFAFVFVCFFNTITYSLIFFQFYGSVIDIQHCICLRYAV